MLERHQRGALLGLVLMEATGVMAWFGLFQARRRTGSWSGNAPTVLVLAVASDQAANESLLEGLAALDRAVGRSP